MKGVASRRVAVEVLLKVEQDGSFAGQALAAAFKNHSLTERDRAFATCIVQGTLRHQFELDGEIKKFSKIRLENLAAPLRAVLRSSLFQLIHLEDMPEAAVINTAVEIARKTGHEGQAKFVNAVLRSFQRERQASLAAGRQANTTLRQPTRPTGAETTPFHSDDQDDSTAARDSAGLARRYSLPEWMVKRWLQNYGEEECLRLLAYGQEIPLLMLRTCLMSITCEGLIEIFRSKGMTVEKSALVPACIKVIDRGGKGGPVSKLPGYSEGLFAVQDDASALVSLILAPSAGQTVADLCAAPGGKSVHLGELLENRGRVVAIDCNQKRLSLLASERRRLGLSNIETLVADGRTYQAPAPFDAVLIDAPCSGTGVINRRSDLRQHRKESDLYSLVETQRALLDNAAEMLKPGGVLVYSTCSIEPEENQENLSWFLEKHRQFRADNLEPFFSPEILAQWAAGSHWLETSKQLKSGYIQLLPCRHGTSGFFICRLRNAPQD
jgi:16S rRNA (cytosine967-C5)-methyltransferase